MNFVVGHDESKYRIANREKLKNNEIYSLVCLDKFKESGYKNLQNFF